MAKSKTERNSTQKMELLVNYIQSLKSGTDSKSLPTVGDLLASRVRRIRLWQGGHGLPVKVREVGLPKRSRLSDSDMNTRFRNLEADLLKVLDEIEDPDIAVDLTMDMRNGAVSLALQMEVPLVGEDLSAIVEASDDDEYDYPKFRDEPFDDSYWSVAEAAKALGVAKSTITRRIKANQIIGFRLFKNAIYVPREQFVRQVPVKGVLEVLKFSGYNHVWTWKFLDSSVFYGEEKDRPIDRLKACRTEKTLKSCLAQLEWYYVGFAGGSHM